MRNKNCRRYGALIDILVLIFFQVNETILKSIVTYPDQDYFYAANFSQMTESINHLVASSCRQVDRCSTTQQTSMCTATVAACYFAVACMYSTPMMLLFDIYYFNLLVAVQQSWFSRLFRLPQQHNQVARPLHPATQQQVTDSIRILLMIC